MSTLRVPMPALSRDGRGLAREALLALGGSLAVGAITAWWPRAGASAGAVAVLVALALRLGPRAPALFVATFAAIPFLDLQHGFLAGSIVPGWLIALAGGLGLAVAALAALRDPAPGAAPSRIPLLLAGALGFLLLVSLGAAGRTLVFGLVPVAFFVGPLAFFLFRRSGRPEGWGSPALAGLAILLGVAAVAYAGGPQNRLGAFTGYPILFAGLLVALGPPALVFLYRRSRALAAGLALATVAALALSQTAAPGSPRSSRCCSPRTGATSARSCWWRWRSPGP